VRHVHEEAGNKRLPNVDIIVFARELGTSQGKIEACHKTCQLLSNTVP
jgi:hypothetical protein